MTNSTQDSIDENKNINFQINNEKKYCSHFLAFGYCKFTDTCKFIHCKVEEISDDFEFSTSCKYYTKFGKCKEK